MAYESVLILRQCLANNSIHTKNTKSNLSDESPLETGTGRMYVSWDPAVVKYHPTLKEDNEGACGEGKGATRGALKRLGINEVEFICQLGGKRTYYDRDSQKTTTTDCLEGSGNVTASNITDKQINEAVKKLTKFTGFDPANPGDAVRYQRSFNILKNGCFGGSSITKEIYDKEPKGKRWSINVYPDGKEYYRGEPGGGSNHNQKPRGANGDEKGEVNCIEYWNRTNTYFSAYVAYKNNLSPEERAAEEAKENISPEAGDDGQTSCRIEGVGWIICPVLNFLGGVTDAAYGGVKELLKTPAMVTTAGSSTEGVYIAWQTMRSVANVAFVIAFLIIIFSQLTSAGVSNYGIKRMLPRLIVAAILVNVSFFICAIGVDLSNIIGSNIVNLFDGIAKSMPTPQWKDTGDFGGSATGEGWLGIIGIIIAGGAIAITTVYIGLAALLPFLLAAILAILTVFIVLTLRQALIILLIVISPLAFVAYLLPNTESWFNRWRKLFTTLLLMFPIIGIIFGASALASQVIMSSSDNIFVQLSGAAIAIIPLALTPVVMKTAGGVLGRVGAFVNNPNKGPFDRMRKGAESLRKDRQNIRNMRALNGKGLPGRTGFTRWKARRGAITAGREGELNRARSEYISDAMQNSATFANSVAGGTSAFGQIRSGAGADATQRALASAINTTSKLELEEITAAGVVLKNAKLDQAQVRSLSNGGSATTSSGMQLNGSGAMRAAAVQQAVASNDISQINDLWDQSRSWGNDKEGNTLRQTLADSLASSSSRPGYIGQGALAGLRTGSNDSIENTIKEAVKANAYSPEKIATADKDELAMVTKTISGDSGLTDDQKQSFMLNAEKALTDENLNVKISKNRDEIKKILDIS
ncbi:hypothetical protein KI440_00125 [Candidatus Saccharibacteria bacterium TM7i]|nr:hypothetical protein KI440_00125 [Candidatus Saccharibacteria bacterium TM7i]